MLQCGILPNKPGLSSHPLLINIIVFTPVPRIPTHFTGNPFTPDFMKKTFSYLTLDLSIVTKGGVSKKFKKKKKKKHYMIKSVDPEETVVSSVSTMFVKVPVLICRD